MSRVILGLFPRLWFNFVHKIKINRELVLEGNIRFNNETLSCDPVGT